MDQDASRPRSTAGSLRYRNSHLSPNPVQFFHQIQFNFSRDPAHPVEQDGCFPPSPFQSGLKSSGSGDFALSPDRGFSQSARNDSDGIGQNRPNPHGLQKTLARWSQGVSSWTGCLDPWGHVIQAAEEKKRVFTLS